MCVCVCSVCVRMCVYVPIDFKAGWAASPVGTRPPGPHFNNGYLVYTGEPNAQLSTPLLVSLKMHKNQNTDTMQMHRLENTAQTQQELYLTITECLIHCYKWVYPFTGLDYWTGLTKFAQTHSFNHKHFFNH